MSAATSLSDARALHLSRCNLAQGRAELAFKAEGGVTRLADLYQSDPLRILFPAVPAGEMPTAVMVTTSGGLVGGDRLDMTVTAGPGTSALVTSQAAEKVYRSLGPDCRVEVRLRVDEGAWLEWLPQECILFQNARLRRLTAIDLAPTARLMAGEMLVFGRTARGERFTAGLARDAWELRRDGRLVWADALHLDGDIGAVMAAPAGFGGATACATMIYAAPDAAAHLETARELLADCPVRAGVTLVKDQLVARWLGEAFDLRRAYGGFWAAFRHRAAGLPASLPRLWHI